MLEWLKKKTLCRGSVLFRGTLAPRPEEMLKELAAAGISVKAKQPGQFRWVLGMQHPHWGKAELFCPPKPSPPPRDMLTYLAGVSEAKRETAKQAGCELGLVMQGTRTHVLADRKAFLRFLRVCMGQDGLVALDSLAHRLWPRVALDEELSHEADLDINQIMGLHAVIRTEQGDEQPVWLHSHGLAEIGFFDFDILNPCEELHGRGSDILRSIGFAIVGGELQPSTPCFELARPGGTMRAVPVETFSRRAAPEFVALRDTSDKEHNQKRVVLCQPAGRLFGRWSRPKPSKFLSSELPEHLITKLSAAATELMARRAAGTVSVLERGMAEVEEFEFPTLVKLGYEADSGEKEHLWFQVHSIADGEIDATLINSPIDIASMKEGDRAWHPVHRLSDWTIITPLGPIDPRSTVALRNIRAHRNELRDAMRNANARS